MGRTRSISDEQILEAARALFLEHGIEAKTTDIAERAGVSEGTIFKRFRTKENLFLKAMVPESRLPWADDLDELVGRGDLRENLEKIAMDMIDFFLEMIPKMNMVLSQNFELKRHIMNDPEAPPLVSLRKLSRYFDQEQRAGRIRRCDSEVLARLFLGALHHYSFAERMGINDRMPISQSTYARGVVATILDGVIIQEQQDSGE